MIVKRTAVFHFFCVGCVALALILGAAAECRAAERAWPSAEWPVSGTIEFQVSFGEGGMTVGQARHTWSHDRGQYRMGLAVETTGVAALLRKLGYEQRSTGGIGLDGLRPRRFDVSQTGKAPEAALFDWNDASGARVSIRRGERERRHASLAAGDQDILSLWHQIGRLGELPETLLVVGNKEARRASVTRLEDGSLRVPAGLFATRHFRIASIDDRLGIDLWLARERGMAPVRVIIADAKAETLVLEATAVQVPGK
ncbi:MAG: DUF3108 domain-containing protein [Azoarcus sp.]|jgi:hypothetical protein|nr:DUF3108 domain-containing protein [Azoarcus sp.]